LCPAHLVEERRGRAAQGVRACPPVRPSVARVARAQVSRAQATGAMADRRAVTRAQAHPNAGASDHPRAADARAAAVQHVFAGDRRDRGRSACGDALKAAALSRTTLSTADVHASTAAASIAISRLPIAHWPCSIHDPCFPKAPPLRLARRATMAGDEMKE